MDHAETAGKPSAEPPVDVSLPADSSATSFTAAPPTRCTRCRATGPAQLLPSPPCLTTPRSTRFRARRDGHLDQTRGRRQRRVLAGMATSAIGLDPADRRRRRRPSSTWLPAGASGYATATTPVSGGQRRHELSGGAGFVLTLGVAPTVKGSVYKANRTRRQERDSERPDEPGRARARPLIRRSQRSRGSSDWSTVAYGDPGSVTLVRSLSPAGDHHVSPALSLRRRERRSPAARCGSAWRHKIAVSTLSYRLRLPRHLPRQGLRGAGRPSGASVRGVDGRVGNRRLGAWHRISLGGVVRLTYGRTFVTRAFGTPRARRHTTSRSAWRPTSTAPRRLEPGHHRHGALNARPSRHAASSRRYSLPSMVLGGLLEMS